MLKQIFLLTTILIMLLVSGCAKGTFSSINTELVKTSSINVVVVGALTEKPQLTQPAYQISTTLLQNLNTNQLVIPEDIDKVLIAEINKLNADDQIKQAAMTLATLLKNSMVAYLDANPDTTNKMVLIRQVLQIVNNVSAAQLQKPPVKDTTIS